MKLNKTKLIKIIWIVIATALIGTMIILPIASSTKKNGPELLSTKVVLIGGSDFRTIPDYKNNTTVIEVKYTYEVVGSKELKYNGFVEYVFIQASECEELLHLYTSKDHSQFGGIILRINNYSDGSRKFQVEDLITTSERNQYVEIY